MKSLQSGLIQSLRCAQLLLLLDKHCQQEAVEDAIAKRDVEAIFNAFASDPLVTCSLKEARLMFDEMVENTKAYLKDYNL